MFQNFNIVFDYLLMLSIFPVQNVLIILNWCLCDFLVLKHIDGVHTLHLHLSLTDVEIFLCCKCSRISILFLIIYWCWVYFLCKMFLLFSTGCLCDFLVLKHIDGVHTLHLHLSLTDVDIFSCCKCSRISILFLSIYWCWLFLMCKLFSSFLTDVYVIFLYWNVLMKCTHFICPLTDVDIFVCEKYSRISVVFLIIYWCWIFFMCKMFRSFSTDVYVIFLYWNILMKCTHFIFICHWLMLRYFCVVNVPEFQYCFWVFTDVDYFSCAKCSYYSQLMSMWFSCTETYWWSVHTSSSFVIDWCWHFFCGKYSRISIMFLIIYWCWLFFMCKMFLLFSTDVYVIFLYWNISMECTHFIFICHWLMLTYFHVENVPQFQYCFWLFTDVDYFSCSKVSLRKFFKRWTQSFLKQVSLRKFL